MAQPAARALSRAGLILLSASAAMAWQAAPDSTRYLAFQIFTGGLAGAELQQSFPPPPASLARTVADIHARISVPAAPGHRLGFITGPLSFDHSDEEIRRQIAEAFHIALQTDMAVGFHIDDSMFWGRLKNLNSPENMEWLDWNGKLATGRRLDWSSKPLKVMPQLCLNSRAVTEEVEKRAAMIGDEVQKGIKELRDDGKEDLFIGVIAGWETQIGRDFDTGKETGYCALTNRGFSAAHPPADFEQARGAIVKEFIALWAQSLAKAGVPQDKIYSHIAFQSEALFQLQRRVNPGAAPASYLEAVNATPPEVAFSPFVLAGFSTYPEPGKLDQLRDELARHGNPPWASCEGTPMAPEAAAKGGEGKSMEGYLGNLFNHGARLVNLFGWGVGDAGNAFRKTLEADAAIFAYRKFLKGESLMEDPMPAPQIPSEALPEKMRLIRQRMPAYVDKNGSAAISSLMQLLEERMKQKKFEDAEKTADELLRLLK